LGYIRHHSILVTGFIESDTVKAHLKAIDIFGGLVSEINNMSTNHYYSFVVFPDGSKEGWEESEKGDANRAAFKAWLEQQRFEDHSSPYAWVEVQYGDENGDTRIIADSDARKREEGE